MTAGEAGPRRTGCLSGSARALYGLLLSLVLFLQPEIAAAKEDGAAARPPKAAIDNEQPPIPVATDTGIRRMTQRDYDDYVRPMGHLPVMSKTYIFGNTIPLPKTDKFGHIHVFGAAPAVPGKAERHR
jgi:hypothetical protein